MLEADEALNEAIKGDSRKKVLMVTHSRVLLAYTAKGVDEEDEYIDQGYFANCEVYPAVI